MRRTRNRSRAAAMTAWGKRADASDFVLGARYLLSQTAKRELRSIVAAVEEQLLAESCGPQDVPNGTPMASVVDVARARARTLSSPLPAPALAADEREPAAQSIAPADSHRNAQHQLEQPAGHDRSSGPITLPPLRVAPTAMPSALSVPLPSPAAAAQATEASPTALHAQLAALQEQQAQLLSVVAEMSSSLQALQRKIQRQS